MFRLLVALSVLCLASAALPKSDRIVNGRTASIIEFPYQVSLQKNGIHYCGGSLISTSCILTAAHCLFEVIRDNLVKYLKIRAGSSKWHAGGVLRNAVSVINHPEYDPDTMRCDVGVVEVDRFVLSAIIKLVSLPRNPVSWKTPVTVSGWGRMYENAQELPEDLLAVSLKFLPYLQCASDSYKYGSEILDDMCCAEGFNKDSCQGDSGGPLVVEDSTPILQIGVVSWGTGCGVEGYPGVYANCAHPVIKKFILDNCKEARYI